MNKPKQHCALCTTDLKNVQFNLKSSNTKYSNTPLIAFIENAAGKLFTLHFDICLQCYDLLNELEAIELRQKEIQNQLKKYVERSKQNITIVPNEFSADVSTTNDTNLLNCTNFVESDIKTELLTEAFDVKSDIDAKREDVKLNDCSMNEENMPFSNLNVSEKPVTKKNGKRKKSANTPKPHKCHCLKEFRTASELKNHINSHDGHRAFICEICGQSYKHRTAFNIHMDMHKGINPFTCVYCNKSFTQKGGLVRHVSIHTGEMSYQCDECGKRFIHHTSFNVHRISHTGLKSFKCALCGLALTSGSHLKRHMRIHTGEKRFACGSCGKRFAERYNLAVHEKLHTNSCSKVSQKRSYSCQICGVNFERKVKLDEHFVKVHQILRSELSSQVLKQSLLCAEKGNLT